ncbi:glycosyltransferase family 4 protein [Palleronia caenipelagi]|uniref:Glycosyltransferase family 4 protein n=1 Tax=Palleronia caenipelagi TaxID=2489174 RepID=A0A547PJR6_9RHOB|nr:glycosyltransferase family 4 protein [Palleronia caenipelagi]TRD14402.1 glycosyltransferase family 4 protein [Palleronia caenipelagi]
MDDTQMTADRNAAIWYARDGFDPGKMGMNGRRVAGESFLEGFLTHADVDAFMGMSSSQAGLRQFRELAAKKAGRRPIHLYMLDNLSPQPPVSTVFFPSPTIAKEAWRRFDAGQTAFSICGITHTTSTAAVLQQFFDLRMAPVEPWDAIICTSRAVQASVNWQIDQIDAYIERRFGYSPPPRPQLPIIPLGLNQSQITAPESAGVKLRKMLGIAPETRVAMTMSRLSVAEKFDPLPIYRALHLAQSEFDGDIALILCGYFSSETDEDIFRKGAARYMPDVALHVVDGKDDALKRAAFSASDLFLFGIDNIQETFGLAPIEAMAAGLPQIVSDWDGLKDTVTPDVGFRIPTILAEGLDRGRTDMRRYIQGIDGYHNYLSKTAARTVIDVRAFADRILLLAQDRDLARKMGRAAKDRVRRHFDWSVIIPQYQSLWETLSQMRRRAPAAVGDRYNGLVSPIAPPAVDVFHSYPSQIGLPLSTRVSASHCDAETTSQAIAELASLRNAPINGRAIQATQGIWRSCHDAGKPISIYDIGAQCGIRPAASEQLIAWLLKYDFLRIVP